MKKFLALLLALLIPVQVQAAITRGTITVGGSTDDFTFSHTVDAGTNLALAVACMMEANAKFNTVTYNSVNVPVITDAFKAHSASQAKIEWFLLVNPSTGSNTVAIDINAADDIACAAINLTGVNQTAPTSGTPQTNEFSAVTTSTISMSCPAGNWFLDAIMSVTAANFTADGENTEINETDAGAFSYALSEDATPDGAVAGSWTMDATEIGVQVGICINAASGAVPGSVIWFR